MAIVTLITDFGNSDYYAALIKGSLLSAHPQLNIVDVTHAVQPFDMAQAAYILGLVFGSFPKGTIHLVSVNNFDGNLAYIAMQREGHYFVGPDNGIFTLIFGTSLESVYRLPYDPADTFPLRQVFCHAVDHILSNESFEKIGLPAPDHEQRIALQPVIFGSEIRGTVIHIDHYENVITNIRRELFEQMHQGRRFEVHFKRHAPLTRLSHIYHDVPPGEPLCFFNVAGLLEIAVNMGKAASLLGIQHDDMVRITFHSDHV